METNERARLLLALALSIGSVSDAFAAANTGSITGRVTVESGDVPMPGVTVTVTGPALQGSSTAETDTSGIYLVPDLPPGQYLVRFELDERSIERPNVAVSTGQTVAVNADFDLGAEIVVRAPTVDVGSSHIRASITKSLTRRTPIRGRNYDAVMTFAPGTARDETGVSFNGGSGPENVYLLDGMNTTNPAYGLLGSPLSLEFVEEAELISAGAAAEHGRSLGGVINLVTKSGSDDFKGSIWGNAQPFAGTPRQVARLGEAIGTVQRRSARAFDFGFDLGGPLIKERLWFYVGFAPSFIIDDYDRIVRSRSASDLPADQTGGTYSGDRDTGYVCPEWLRAESDALCAGGGFATRTIDGATRTLSSTARSYHFITKLDMRISDEHRLAFEYTGSPSTFSGVFNDPSRAFSAGNLAGAGFNADPAQMGFEETVEVHDVAIRSTSKFLDGDLHANVLLGYHQEHLDIDPIVTDASQTIDGRASSITRYEDVPGCEPTTIHGVSFDPCPVQNYLYGGFGYYEETRLHRWTVAADLTYLFDLAGSHAVKLGADLQASRYKHHRLNTGTGQFTIFPDGTVLRFGYSGQLPDGSTDVKTNGFIGDTTSQSEALFLRDSYSIAALPGAVINAGLRWDLQQLQNQNGETVFNLTDSFSPRIGVLYDWTNEGRGKVHASYGRFFEAVPLDLLDRQHTGEANSALTTTDCQTDANGKIDSGSCRFPQLTPGDLFGGFGNVAPKLKGAYSNEIVAGVEYDVGWNLVLGASYVHRDFGRAIEDTSLDSAKTFFIGNPGEPADPDVVREVQAEIEALGSRISAANAEERDALVAERDTKIALLSGYLAQERLPKPKRDYNALVLTAKKSFSDDFLLLASYTYSRTLGNYDGLYNSAYMQLDPNVNSDFDLPDLITNRQGPLPNDRPHNLKLAAAYFFKTGDDEKDGVTVGLVFNAQSGTPINVLGGFPFYGRRVTFILPRGSGGRTPTTTQLDLRFAYSTEVAEGYRMDLVGDIFNLFNSRGVLAVDQEYTIDEVLGIANGSYADLATLRAINGEKVAVNPNYGQPIAYQAPIAARVGARLSF
jgi:hypothetical protein